MKHPRSSNGLVILQVGIQAVFSYLSNVFSDMLGSRADVPSWFVAIESKLVLLLVPVERETEV